MRWVPPPKKDLTLTLSCMDWNILLVVFGTVPSRAVERLLDLRLGATIEKERVAPKGPYFISPYVVCVARSASKKRIKQVFQLIIQIHLLIKIFVNILPNVIDVVV